MSHPDQPDDPGATPPADQGEPMSEHEPEPMPGEPVPEPPTPMPPATEDDLREAVGVPRREQARRAKSPTLDDRDAELADELPLSAEERAGRRRTWITLGLSLVVGLVILAFVVLGRANSSRLVFACSADTITAEHGRGFPPWGTRTLDGPEWAPITIPPQAECKTRETEDPAELEGWYLDALVEQASAKLSAREVTAFDDADKQLHQALLLSRAPERRDQRREIERLLGDVVYWRAAAKVKGASDALADAAKLFDEAALKKPRNVTDAAAWGDYARRLADELHAGPEALRPDGIAAPIAPTRPPAPTGVALPVEMPDARPAEGAPIAPPDAGVPSGGVLL